MIVGSVSPGIPSLPVGSTLGLHMSPNSYVVFFFFDSGRAPLGNISNECLFYYTITEKHLTL